MSAELETLLLEEARKYVRTGEMPWAPGYRVAIEEHPDEWEDAIDLARAESKQADLARGETVAELENLGYDAEMAEKATPTLEQLFEMRQRLGRKFEPADVTMGLREVAEELARTYEGDFAFMVEMRKSVKERRLSIGQAKGVLNSMTARRPERPRTPPVVGRTPGQPVPQGAITDGIYLHDGKVVKVQKAVHGSGNLYAKVLIAGDQDTFDMQHGYRHGAKAHFEYAPGLVRQLKVEERMTLAQAKEFGALYGVCCVCGATLTDEVSIEAGIGPICGGRLAREGGW